jgi:hypothetical protein
MNDSNPFAVATAAKGGSSVEIMQHRQASEVQAGMVVAKKFPRDEVAAYERIMRSCQRKTLAEVAVYSYPRGGTKVEGPSIRLAEELARGWGNINYGVTELEQRPGESVCQAYAWDMETNVRREMTFVIKHQRKAQGAVKDLTDPRDIYEMIANQGARRVRNCILGVVPGDICEAALEQVNKTLIGGVKGEPLPDRIRKMVVAFAQIGVTLTMLEKRIQHKISACSAVEVVNLGKIFNSLNDGQSAREQWFEVDDITTSATTTTASTAPNDDDNVDMSPTTVKAPAETAPAKETPPEKAPDAPKSEPVKETIKEPVKEPAKEEAKAPVTLSESTIEAPAAAGEPHDPAKVAENITALDECITAINVSPEAFMKWNAESNVFRSCTEFGKLRAFPKRVAWLLDNWEAGKNFKDAITAWAQK